MCLIMLNEDRSREGIEGLFVTDILGADMIAYIFPHYSKPSKLKKKKSL